MWAEHCMTSPAPAPSPSPWPRDDEVISWRSLDTLHGIEHRDIEYDAISENSAEFSDGDEFAEIMDRRFVGIKAKKAMPHNTITRVPVNISAKPSLGPEVRKALLEQELPSTSEMVRIQEPIAAPTTHAIAGTATIALPSPPPHQTAYPSPQDQHGARVPVWPVIGKAGRDDDHTFTDIQQLQPSYSPLPAPSSAWGASAFPVGTAPIPTRSGAVGSSPRHPMSLGDLMAAKTKALTNRSGAVNPAHSNQQTSLAEQELRAEIDRLAEELARRNDQVRGLQSEETRLRDRVQQLEGQVRHLQSALIEREKKDEHDIQLILKKSTELVAIQEKYQAIQETNAILQEQARKAVDEKERVQKDYLQVVYDLGKAQKQLNALSKQNVGSAQSDVLLREVDRLKHENEQLTVKLRDAEAKKGAASASVRDNSSSEQVNQLQRYIRELENEVRMIRSTVSASHLQPPPAPTSAGGNREASQRYGSSRTTNSTDPTSPKSPQIVSLAALGIDVSPTKMAHHHLPAHGNGQGANAKSMSLKDILADKTPEKGRPEFVSTGNRTTSLASMGYGAPMKASSIDFEKIKAEALARRNPSSSVADLMRHQSFVPQDSRLPLHQSVDTAISAPFATEKHSQLQDAVQRRQLEQQLMALQVEKEQFEAKLVKNEQTANKTMSARAEKAWLENKLRVISGDISKLKLSLR